MYLSSWQIFVLGIAVGFVFTIITEIVLILTHTKHEIYTIDVDEVDDNDG